MTALLTLERNLQLERLCEEILGIDKQIQLVVIVNQKGRVIENKMRDDRCTKDITEQKKEMLFMEFTLQISMYRDFDNEFGPVKCGFLIREKISISFFPLEEHIVIVFSNSGIDHLSLHNKMTKTINTYNTIKQIVVN